MVVTGPTPEIPWISIGGEMDDGNSHGNIHGKYMGNPRSIDLMVFFVVISMRRFVLINVGFILKRKVLT